MPSAFCRLFMVFNPLPTVVLSLNHAEAGTADGISSELQPGCARGEGRETTAAHLGAAFLGFAALRQAPEAAIIAVNANPKVPIMRIRLLILATLVGGSASLFAETPAWQPAAGI